MQYILYKCITTAIMLHA